LVFAANGPQQRDQMGQQNDNSLVLPATQLAHVDERALGSRGGAFARNSAPLIDAPPWGDFRKRFPSK